MSATRAALALVLLAVGTSVSAASKSELENRIQQLERKLDSRSLVDLMDQVKALQREVQQLRGDIEVQAHNTDGLQKRQRDLYLDIDRRLHRLETGGVEAAPAADAAAPGAATAGAGLAAPASGSAMGGSAMGGSAMGGSAMGEPAPVMGSAAASAAAAAPPAVTLNPADERKDYDSALEILKEGRYNEASTAFQQFLSKYPGSGYADNAQYWLGEVFYVTREFESALGEFEKVVTAYPDSSKVADAKLKMGYIRYELKDWDKARELLNQVVQNYPGSTSARLAQERLERMTSEGH
jgi:tol-pal system protein YbgF